MADVKIIIRPNGPLRVEGSVELVWADGTPVDTTGKPFLSLCRCGASSNKPFCDGMHTKIGFQAAREAVPGSELAEQQHEPGSSESGTLSQP